MAIFLVCFWYGGRNVWNVVCEIGSDIKYFYPQKGAGSTWVGVVSEIRMRTPAHEEKRSDEGLVFKIICDSEPVKLETKRIELSKMSNVSKEDGVSDKFEISDRSYCPFVCLTI